MSARRLPRQFGVIIRCNGEGCGERFQTANIFVGVNRKAMLLAGWSRGLTRGRKRLDLCPAHAKVERARVAELAAKREARRQARDQKRTANPSPEATP